VTGLFQAAAPLDAKLPHTRKSASRA